MFSKVVTLLLHLLDRMAAVKEPGRHLKYKKNMPLTNLYLAILRRMGVKADSFRDSTGELSGLV